MAKTFLKNISVFLFMLILFAGLANGISFVLTDTLFAFFGYPTFPAAANAANPLHVLIPAVFLYFSLPCIAVFAPQAQFGIKKTPCPAIGMPRLFLYGADSFLGVFLLFHPAPFP